MGGKRYRKPKNTPQPETQTQNSMQRSAVMAQITASFSGPLPPPGLLGQYNDAVPNGAERIMSLVERQSSHRESLEARVVKSNTLNQTLGTIFAAVIVLASIGCGTFLVSAGKSAEGLTAIIAALGGVVGVFFRSRAEQRKERIEKASALESHRKR